MTLPAARYLFFGGKGGVGKTTAASAAALRLLEQAGPDERILLFSTDPAHSLSDSLDLPVGDRVAEVARSGTAVLEAREMDAGAALARFKERHRGVLGQIAERGTFLDEADVNELLDLSLPGMDEVMALFELSQSDRANVYARVVVDTAPSGHTARLLRLPDVFTRWIATLDRLSEKHRYIVAQFARGGRVREDEADAFLRDLSERVQRVRAMLYDGNQTAFTLVTVPEAMSVEEAVRYFALLGREGVPVTDLIINRIERPRADCPYCRARAAGQEPWLARIENAFAALRLHRVPLLAGEVRGLPALRRFARLTWDPPGADSEEPEGAPDEAVVPAPASPPARPGFVLEPPPRLLVFGGKGGVGKTTAAAAAALALAEADSRRRVLVFSTDPAHSLSDSFGEPVGECRRGVAGRDNLDAMEIDPGARFEALKARYRAWTDALFASLTGGSRWTVQFDREAMQEMVALAPPGIDEIAALSAVSDLLEQGDYATIVLDTAPTGHLVRFLELPGVALSWVHTFLKLLLKYKEVVPWDGVAEELIALSKEIKRVTALLTDADACEFVGVAIPERMSLEETVRLAATLENLRVPMQRLLINNVAPAEAAAACGFCATRRRAQDAVIEAFRERFAGLATLYTAPLQPHEVRGPGRLREHFARWEALPS